VVIFTSGTWVRWASVAKQGEGLGVVEVSLIEAMSTVEAIALLFGSDGDSGLDPSFKFKPSLTHS